MESLSLSLLLVLGLSLFLLLNLHLPLLVRAMTPTEVRPQQRTAHTDDDTLERDLGHRRQVPIHAIAEPETHAERDHTTHLDHPPDIRENKSDRNTGRDPHRHVAKRLHLTSSKENPSHRRHGGSGRFPTSTSTRSPHDRHRHTTNRSRAV